jgi:hypothetical protein
MVAEDALDRYVIKRIVARTLLNPARSFANLMDWRARPGIAILVKAY